MPMILVVLVAGCVARRPNLPATEVPAAFLSEPYRVHAGDALQVKFEYHADDSRQIMVGTDGRATLPVTGDMHVAGMTLAEVEALVEKRASRFLRKPVVTVSIVDSKARAYVGGEVVNPGFVSLIKPMSAVQAILERGGFLATANVEEIVVLSQSAGEPVARQLDLKKKLREGNLEGMMLAADEIVLVPKTGVATANQWVDQWINGLIPDIVERALRFGTIPVF